MTYDEALDHILSDLPAFLEATEDALCEALTTDAQIADWNSRPRLGRHKKIEAAKAERDMARDAAMAMKDIADWYRRGPAFQSHLSWREQEIGCLMAHFVEKAAARMAEGVR